MNTETGQSIPQDMSAEGVPEVEQEPQQDWFFTFGADHTHPDTGERLGRSFVRLAGTCDSTRTEMLAAFGNRWAFQYRSAVRAGVEQYGLTEVPMPQSFAVQLDTHLLRLEAERVPAAEVRIGEDPQRCPNCAPGYDCERGIYTPVTPAEERTGVSDVQAERLNEVAALRRLVHTYGLFCEQFGAAREALDLTERNEALRSLKDAKEKLTSSFDRIESWVRGEQR